MVAILVASYHKKFKVLFHVLIAVDHEPFTQSWNVWRQKQSECMVEDMEIDNFEPLIQSSSITKPLDRYDTKIIICLLYCTYFFLNNFEQNILDRY